MRRIRIFGLFLLSVLMTFEINAEPIPPKSLSLKLVREAFVQTFECSLPVEQDFEPKDPGTVAIVYRCNTGFLIAKVMPGPEITCQSVSLIFDTKDMQKENDALTALMQLVSKLPVSEASKRLQVVALAYFEKQKTDVDNAKSELIVNGFIFELSTYHQGKSTFLRAAVNAAP